MHRIGQTARAGKKGYAFTFVSGRETYKLREIQSYTHAKIRREQIPTLEEVEESRSTAIIGKVREQIEEGDLDKYVNILEKLLREDFSSVEAAAALLKMALATGGKEVDFQEQFAEPEPRRRSMTRLRLNVGRKHKATPRDILGALAGETGLPGKAFGKIDIHDDVTFVEVPGDYVSEVIRMMKDRYIKGRKLVVGPSK